MKNNNLLFIPVYNCPVQLKRLLSKYNEEDFSYYQKILIVDNCSRDETVKIAKETILKKGFKNFKIIRNKQNYGLGGSHKIAFKYAIDNGFDYCCVLHGDDQGDLNDLNKVILKKDFFNFSCLRAGRFKPGSKLIGYSNFRIFGNNVFRYIYSLLINKKVYDIGAGLAIYKINDIKKINYEYLVNDMSFDSFMLLVMDYYQLKYDFFTVTWKEEDQISNTKLLNTACTILKNLILYKINKKKFIESFYADKLEEFNNDIIL
jgi:glycosyltransferase involved in cell wall biosynthesis